MGDRKTRGDAHCLRVQGHFGPPGQWRANSTDLMQTENIGRKSGGLWKNPPSFVIYRLIVLEFCGGHPQAGPHALASRAMHLFSYGENIFIDSMIPTRIISRRLNSRKDKKELMGCTNYVLIITNTTWRYKFRQRTEKNWKNTDE